MPLETLSILYLVNVIPFLAFLFTWSRAVPDDGLWIWGGDEEGQVLFSDIVGK